MKERPMTFNGEMVWAIINGRKTQTRRPFKEAPPEGWKPFAGIMDIHKWDPVENGIFLDREGNPKIVKQGVCNEDGDFCYTSPFGVVGDRLWVQEEAYYGFSEEKSMIDKVAYSQKNKKLPKNCWPVGFSKKMPQKTMPRWASRITLEITDVRVERLQDISLEDAKKEGVEKRVAPFEFHDFELREIDKIKSEIYCYRDYHTDYHCGLNAIESFESLWNKIYGKSKEKWKNNPWVWVYEFKWVRT